MDYVYGLTGVVLYILTGYMKSGERFDVRKALRTLVIGTLLIALNLFIGVEIPAPELETILTAGEVALAENIIKAVRNRL